MKKFYYIQFLKAFCALQVFFLHYFAGHGLRSEVWWFSGAVPTFLLMSAWMYGLRDGGTYDGKFLKRRFKALSVTYYPFILVVFIAFLIINPHDWAAISRGFLVDVLYLGGIGLDKGLPQSGHLWFMTTLMVCYVALVVATKIQKRYFISTPPKKY